MKIITLKLPATLSLILLLVGAAAAQIDNSPECVRARPKRILSRKIYPRAAFKLVKNKSFPFEYVGFETVKMKNGDKLTIKNYGCENYSLDFQFETKRFSVDPRRVRFWYQTAAQLMETVAVGLKDEYLPNAGTKALQTHIRKNKTLRFDEEIIISDSEIREVAFVPAVKKGRNGKYTVVVSIGMGPL